MADGWYREKIKTLYTGQQIADRIKELGAEITRDYRDKPLVLLCILKGSYMFAADLCRAIDLPLRIEFLGVQSYGDGTSSTGVVQITLDLTRPIEGEEVLVVEDIVDTGLTLDYIQQSLKTRNPASVKVCALCTSRRACKRRSRSTTSASRSTTCSSWGTAWIGRRSIATCRKSAW